MRRERVLAAAMGTSLVVACLILDSGAASAIGVATLVLTIVILTGLLRTMNAVVREGA